VLPRSDHGANVLHVTDPLHQVAHRHALAIHPAAPHQQYIRTIRRYDRVQPLRALGLPQIVLRIGPRRLHLPGTRQPVRHSGRRGILHIDPRTHEGEGISRDSSDGHQKVPVQLVELLSQAHVLPWACVRPVRTLRRQAMLAGTPCEPAASWTRSSCAPPTPPLKGITGEVDGKKAHLMLQQLFLTQDHLTFRGSYADDGFSMQDGLNRGNRSLPDPHSRHLSILSAGTVPVKRTLLGAGVHWAQTCWDDYRSPQTPRRPPCPRRRVSPFWVCPHSRGSTDWPSNGPMPPKLLGSNRRDPRDGALALAASPCRQPFRSACRGANSIMTQC
jgi:hypothetical protein